MFALFTDRHIVRSSSNMAAPKNIHLTHILTLGERTLLKLGVLSSLFIAYNIAISSVDFIHWIVPNLIFTA